jgi:hypothetical protein
MGARGLRSSLRQHRQEMVLAAILLGQLLGPLANDLLQLTAFSDLASQRLIDLGQFGRAFPN